jgi:hypothetical protein
MRGGDVRTGELFSYVDLEDRMRRDHPLRAIRLILNDALASLEGNLQRSIRRSAGRRLRRRNC